MAAMRVGFLNFPDPAYMEAIFPTVAISPLLPPEGIFVLN